MASGFSVIIPAHNEAKVIRRCLEGLLAGAPAGEEPELIVVCNGCSDDTAAIARQVGIITGNVVITFDAATQPPPGGDTAAVIPGSVLHLLTDQVSLCIVLQFVIFKIRVKLHEICGEFLGALHYQCVIMKKS